MLLRILYLVFFASILFSSCVTQDDLDRRCGNDWSPVSELEDELQAVVDASVTFSNDPTTANCNAYKQAILDYLDEIRNWEDCYIYIGQKDAFNDAVDQAEEDANNIDC